MNSKERTLNNNLIILEKGLVIESFGNASSRDDDIFYIKPSGVNLMKMKSTHMVSVRIHDGKYLGKMQPSSDTPTHLELYKKFPEIGGIVHTHSVYATAWAQAVKPIPCLGTTHADYWHGEVPTTRELSDKEINGAYEKETGKVIIETLNNLNFDPLDCPGILVACHGSFTWGKTIEDAVKHAELLECIARMAWMTKSINPGIDPLSESLLDRHFYRKHGPDAYYGQKSE